MTDIHSMSLRVSNGSLYIIDQYALPHSENWIEIKSPEDMVAAIKQLKVRGAPLIGVAAALSLAVYAEQGASTRQLTSALEKLWKSRPTAVNLMVCLERMKLRIQDPFDLGGFVREAEEIFKEDVELCDGIASHGESLFEPGDQVLTHCNTGGLATVGVGTALGVIGKAFEKHQDLFVWVDETRPLLQGGRLTSWELAKLNIPHKLICDNMAASLMAQGRVTKVIVGADRIAINGDFANKIGTYGLAVLAYYHRIPFYVAAPYTTIDFECERGKDIPIEERVPDEVTGVSGSFGSVQWAPEDCKVYNPAFDVTPNEFVTGWILETGIYSRDEVKAGALKRKD